MGGRAAMLIGYIRVSKSDGTQTLAPQREALLAAGVDPSRIYEDLASGQRDDRPGLAACLKAIQPGNTLVLWKLDRLSRDLRHLVITVEELRTRGIELKVLIGANVIATGLLPIFGSDRPHPARRQEIARFPRGADRRVA